MTEVFNGKLMSTSYPACFKMREFKDALEVGDSRAQFVLAMAIDLLLDWKQDNQQQFLERWGTYGHESLESFV